MGDSLITINGVELKLDLLDADIMEKYENANDRARGRFNDSDSMGDMTEAGKMRYLCRAVDDFFDELFGEGTAAGVFGERNNNLGDHIRAFADVATFAAQSGERVRNIAQDYAPQVMNRAQRRAAQRAKPQPEPKPYGARVPIAGVHEEPEERKDSSASLVIAELEARGYTREQLLDILKDGAL